jgi:hypothetical protein
MATAPGTGTLAGQYRYVQQYLSKLFGSGQMKRSRCARTYSF